MGDWDGFYALTGGTAGVLIGLIFVVITLGMEHAKEGDTVRTRLFITPILVYFVSLLITSLAMIPPLSEVIRALALGVIGCAGLGYTFNLALLLRRPGAPEEIEALWLFHGGIFYYGVRDRVYGIPPKVDAPKAVELLARTVVGGMRAVLERTAFPVAAG